MPKTAPTAKTSGSGRTGNEPQSKPPGLPGTSTDAPPTGLEQIGDTPFFQSPVEPVEPDDCERWPNSPYCGGSGVGDKFIDLGIDLSKDKCSVCVSIEPTLGLISMPPLTYCYIKPECQEEYKNPPPPPPIIPETAPPPDYPSNWEQEWPTFYEMPSLPPGDPNVLYTIYFNWTAQTEIVGFGYDIGGVYIHLPGDNHTPYKDSVKGEDSGYSVVRTKGIGSLSSTTESTYIPYIFNWYDCNVAQKTNTVKLHYTGYITEFVRVYNSETEMWEWIWTEPTLKTIFVGYLFGGSNQRIVAPINWWGSCSYAIYSYNIEIYPQPPELEPEPETPQNPPTTPREPQMKCNCDRIEEMLRLLLKRVGKPTTITTPNKDKVKKQKVVSLSEAVTKWSEAQSEDFSEVYKVVEPRSFEKASYPMRLTHPGAKGDKPVRNFLQAWEAIIRQVDKVSGSFPFKIRIKDTNSAQKGDQSVDLEVWSIADAFRLIIQNVIDTEGDVDIINNLLVRIGSMMIQQHQVLARINSTTQNTEDFLDYKVKQKIINIPSTLNPLLPSDNKGFGEAKKIDENTEQSTESLLPHFMQNTYLKVKITELDEKRLLGERLYSIEKHATNAAAGNTVHYQGENTLKNLIEGAMQVANMEDYLLRENVRKAIGIDKTELKDFEKQVEQGYPEAIGKQETDKDKPYGRPKSKAPKIKRTRRMK